MNNLNCLLKGNSQVKGILHCSALEAYTKYEMACLIADLFAIDKSHIKPDETVSAQSMLRPKNSQLDTEYTFKLINFYPLLKFRDSIKDCLENFAWEQNRYGACLSKTN